MIDYGYLVDLLDVQDRTSLLYTGQHGSTAPDAFDMSAHAVILDQGIAPTCVLNAAAGAIRLRWSVEGMKDPPLISRLDGYYRARKLARIQNENMGCYPRDAWKALNEGYCLERHYPYSDREADVMAKPGADVAYHRADQVNLLQYYRAPTDLRRVREIKAMLSRWHPVCIGLSVDWALQNYQSGVWAFSGDKLTRLGRHYVLLTGYDDRVNAFKFANSWGPYWGMGGFGLVSYDCVLDPYNTTDPVGLIVAPPPSDFGMEASE